jgi:putative peptidoglycan lipid II flippase
MSAATSTNPTTVPDHDPHHAKAAAPLSAAVRVVSGLTLLSRFAGLIRDVVTARMFGLTALGSGFQAAYALPNLFRRLFGEGALSAAFLPEYTLLKRDHPQLSDQLASITLWALTLVTGGLTLLFELVVLLLIFILPPDPDRTLSLKLVMLMLPMAPAVCITAILGGMLQAHGRFGPPAAAPIILNLFQVAASGFFYLHWVSAEPAAFLVGAAAVVASGVQIAWSLAALRGKVHWTRTWQHASRHGKNVLGRFIPAVLGLGTLQLNTMMDTVLAMWPVWVGATMFGRAVTLDAQSNALIRYMQTIYQFPLGVFGLAVATAVFPLLSRATDKPEQFVEHLRRGLRLSLFIGLPASIGLFLVRYDIIATIYGGGKLGFDTASTVRAAAVLAGFAPAVWAYSLNHVFTRAFYAKHDTKTPMFLALGMVGLNFTLNLILIWPLREAGLAWSTATSAVAQCLILGLLCARRLNVRPLDPTTVGALARIVFAGLLMGGAVWGMERLWPSATTWLGHIVRLLGCVTAGAGIYAAFAVLLKLPELKWLLHRGSSAEAAAAMSFD